MLGMAYVENSLYVFKGITCAASLFPSTNLATKAI
jgi:hypothetical protein